MERLIANLLESYRTSQLNEKKRRQAEIRANASTAGRSGSGIMNKLLWENERNYLFDMIKFWGSKHIENASQLGIDVSPYGEASLKNEICTFISSEFGRIRNEFKDFLRGGMIVNPAFDSVADKTLSELMTTANREAEIVIDSIKKQLIQKDYEKVQKAPPMNKIKLLQNMGNSYSWITIAEEFGITKKEFGRKINFVKDKFLRSIIFRDIEHAYVLAKNGFSKPSVILSGAVIEELLRQYLIHKKIKSSNNTFDEYIKACQNNSLLKKAIHSLSDSVRHFRNIVHIEKEKSKTYSISKATAIGAVSSIYTIANDF